MAMTDELENFAWRNGHLREGDLPLSELRARQTLVSIYFR